MDRREFLIGLGAALLVAPAAFVLNNCGGGGSSSANNPPAPAATFSVISSVVFGHTHNVTMQFTDLADPPSGGITYQSDGATHVHQITLSQQQLTDINNGATVTATSTVVNNHTHDWTITKPAA
jgi:hypothetical protein